MFYPTCGFVIPAGVQVSQICGMMVQQPPPAPPPNTAQTWAPQSAPQGQYPLTQPTPAYAAPPPSQANAPSKSLPIILAVVVAVIVIVAALSVAVYFLTRDVGEETHDELITLSLGAPDVKQKSRNSGYVWDTTIAVNLMVPLTAEVAWTEVKVLVKSSTGAQLLASTTPAPDNPSAYRNSVDVWYVDVDGDGRMDVGDSIKITGMSSSYEGATIELSRGGRLVGASLLPTTFPEDAKLTVNLGNPTTPEKHTRTTACWDISMNINRITPNDQKVLWTELKILIKGSTGSLLLISTTPTADTGVYADPAVIQVWYIETGANTRMDAGDAIKITGMTTAYEGATVELTKAGNLIASATLPTNFP